MLNWMLCTNNEFKVSHRKQFNAASNINLVISLMNFECKKCGIFEGLSYHQVDRGIDPNISVYTVGLGYIIKKLVSSNFMVMVNSFSVIFETGATY